MVVNKDNPPCFVVMDGLSSVVYNQKEAYLERPQTLRYEDWDCRQIDSVCLSPDLIIL